MPHDDTPATFEEFSDLRLVALYDALNPSRTDVEFYLALAADFDAASIVDVGCGTGAITVELAQRAERVTGVDPARAMLEVARTRPGGDRVTWIEGDASALNAADADLAIMTAHVPQVITDEDAWRATLVGIHDVLRPRGTLAFESRNPEAQAWLGWTEAASRRRVERSPWGPLDVWYQVTEVRDDPAGTLVQYGIHYRFAETDEEVVSTNVLRFRSRAHIEAALDAAGFTVREVFGDWDRSPLGPASPEMIFVGTRG